MTAWLREPRYQPLAPPPNTRVQRTRSSASRRRSPLTRRPLGHGRLVWLFVIPLVLAPHVATCQSAKQAWLHMPTKPSLLAGFGSHPLEPDIATMWLASAPMPPSGMRPALMIYFVGPRGWLSDDVTPFADLDRDPAIADFLVGNLRLLLKFWPAKGTIEVFGQEISVTEKNVLIATYLGEHGPLWIVRTVGAFRDVVPDGANPAEYVLQHTPEALKVLK
jgi:hypothetical protein